MGIVKEFKEFAVKGNVIDMAVGIVIGGAFSKIVQSFVKDVIMPPLGLLVGGVDFTELKLIISEAELDASGKVIQDAVSINYGVFIQTVFSFIIIAFAVFMVIKGMNRLKRKEEEKPAAPAAPPADIVLLQEIRDLLKK